MKQALSYSQSLRVIGQALEALRINAFELEKKGEEYIKLRGIRKAAVAPDAVGYTVSPDR
jgi:hypothetical protein